MKIILAKLLYLLRLAVPWILRFIFFSLRWTLRCMAAQFKGMPEAVNLIAREWVEKAIKSGFPNSHEKQLRFVMKAIAWVLIIFGYVIACHIVVWIFWRLI